MRRRAWGAPPPPMPGQSAAASGCNSCCASAGSLMGCKWPLQWMGVQARDGGTGSPLTGACSEHQAENCYSLTRYLGCCLCSLTLDQLVQWIEAQWINLPSGLTCPMQPRQCSLCGTAVRGFRPQAVGGSMWCSSANCPLNLPVANSPDDWRNGARRWTAEPIASTVALRSETPTHRPLQAQPQAPIADPSSLQQIGGSRECKPLCSRSAAPLRAWRRAC